MRQVKKSEKKMSLPTDICPSSVIDSQPVNARPVMTTKVAINIRAIIFLPVTNLLKLRSGQETDLRFVPES
jgi:hypothetical protein